MSQVQSASQQNSTLLVVLCGKFAEKQWTPARLGPEAKQVRLSYPFPELVSSGRLEVHTLINPSVEQFRETQRAVQPNLLYIQGQQLENEKEIGTLVWGDTDLSDPEAFGSLISPPFPAIVYLEVPIGEKLAQSLHSKSVRLGPRLLGEAPKVNIILPGNEMGEEEGCSEASRAIKVYDEDVNMKFLVCGVPCTLDACLLTSLEDGLNALLNIEIRGSKLQNRVRAKAHHSSLSSAPPPPLEAETLPHGVVTMRCDITTCCFSHVSLLVSGSAHTCFDDQLLEGHIKNEIIEKRQLVRALPKIEDSKLSAPEPLTSMCMACGASTFEVWMTMPKWASQEDFLKDVMHFLIQRGHTRLVPQGGMAEFPDAVLNSKRLDLYTLYKEVVSRGGFYVGNGINWKGQVFSKMRNHTITNKMTGVGNTLKRHYETYLLEYELAHDDVDGECCLLCHSSAPGDWVNCGLCGEWAHFGCDTRQGLGTFKDYAKADGLEYICPQCSVAKYKKPPTDGRVGNGFMNLTSMPQTV
ncbi:hypothetical protein PR202_gb03024 [Eleusine coracana subsp. coracana]|uniref:ARID domain-containing protein n=1 Tax=Eleusine coracana subsp. coracana TaxID=191504 RepID=A0AAV5DZC0_ELECO|nr:hypothetical protein PR202_gb03024 [Eleusine coracana subsp. coracana]